MSDPPFPEKGILWRKWSAETAQAIAQAIAQKARPVLVFVADPDPRVFPFLREIFKAMPRNARLRETLLDDFIALYLEKNSLPDEVGLYGAGADYHIAILSPSGLTPLVTFGLKDRSPPDIVAGIVAAFEGLRPVWI